MIDQNNGLARYLVDRLHAAAARAGNSELRELLQDSAALLDGYQAGLELAAPHPLTGYALVHSQKRAQIDTITNDLEEIAA